MSRRLQAVAGGVQVKEREMYKRILVGVDDSAAATRALGRVPGGCQVKCVTFSLNLSQFVAGKDTTL